MISKCIVPHVGLIMRKNFRMAYNMALGLAQKISEPDYTKVFTEIFNAVMGFESSPVKTRVMMYECSFCYSLTTLGR